MFGVVFLQVQQLGQKGNQVVRPLALVFVLVETTAQVLKGHGDVVHRAVTRVLQLSLDAIDEWLEIEGRVDILAEYLQASPQHLFDTFEPISSGPC